MNNHRGLNVFLVLSFIFLLFSCESSLSEKKSENEDSIKAKRITQIHPDMKSDFVFNLESSFDKSKNIIYTPTVLFVIDQIDSMLDFKNELLANNNFGFPKLPSTESYKESLLPNEFKNEIKITGSKLKAMSSFSKSFQFIYPFSKVDTGMMFNGNRVRCFGFQKYIKEAFKNVRLIYYKDDDKFIVKIITRSNSVFLAKGFNEGHTLQECLYKANKATKDYSDSLKKHISAQVLNAYIHPDNYLRLNDSDQMYIPELNFNLKKTYSEFNGVLIPCKQANLYVDSLNHRISFGINKDGIKLETDAELLGSVSIKLGGRPKPLKLIFDKPYLIYLCRENTGEDKLYPPFFVMRVQNSELMIKSR